MKEVKNLWSDGILQESDILLPIAILQKQAEYFNQMTKNVLVASVESSQHSRSLNPNPFSDSNVLVLEHRLIIKASMLGNYSFVGIHCCSG